MFITKKHIPRRTFLRGMGVTLALPLFDAMLPAQTPLSKTVAGPRLRASFLYMQHGAIMSQWTPEKQGAGFEFKRILKPLEPFRDRLLIVSGLEVKTAGPAPGESGGDHVRSAAAFLSGARAKRTAGVDVYLGTTIDQVIAKKIGQDTVLPSLEQGIEDVGYTGICNYGYSCSYVNTIAWESPRKPIPMEINPKVVFERLFGDGSTAAQRLARKHEDHSILDSITHDVARFKKVIGAGDRARLNDYLDEVREIERRVQLVSKVGAELPLADVPVGVPQTYDDHIKLQFDLQVLALKTEITRVATFMYGRDNTNTTHPASGVTLSHHGASHHSNRPEAIDTFARINAYFVNMYAYLLEKMRSTPDGDGTLLDNSMVLLGSSMANANEHDHAPVPMLVAGGGAGSLNPGRHIRCADNSPHSNLLLSLINRAGIPMETFGDSTGMIEV
jgi:hypothetical protein